jgi:enterochelin esterase family protein
MPAKTVDLLERAKTTGTPLIDANTVTFLWLGETPPQLMGDFSDWERKTKLDLTEVAPKIWTYSREFAADAYLEYAFIQGKERLLDPFNRRKIFNGVNAYNNLFTMPDYKPTTWTKLKKGVNKGEVVNNILPKNEDLAGKNRQIYLYKPATDKPVPLLYVLDGKDYYKRAKLTTIVDNLIAEKRIPPIAMVMVDNGSSSRFIEYFCNEALIAYQILPVIERAKEYINLIDVTKQPGAYGILGASMGGLMSLYTGIRIPEIFGKVISQSGAFEFQIGKRDIIVFDLIRDTAVQPLNIFMDVGIYEWLLEPNHRMKKVLEEKGYQPTYREYSAGHNYTAWRDELAYGLEVVFG